MSTITPPQLEPGAPPRPDFSVALTARVVGVLILLLTGAALALLAYGQTAPGL